MRVEPYGIGSVVHVVNRGVRGMNITADDADRQRFKKLLFYANDEHQCHSQFGWEHDVANLGDFMRPSSWPERVPLVRILAWTLMTNHFHLILQEVREGGISKFMQRLGGSMSTHFNTKYQQKGSLFQGSFYGRTMDTDEYLRYGAAYVMAKNTFELFPGGLSVASVDLDRVWDWAARYPYSSFSVYATGSDSPILASDENVLRDIFPTPRVFKDATTDMFLAWSEKRIGEYEPLMLESW